MALVPTTDIGGFVSQPDVNDPRNDAGGTTNGSGIDRLSFGNPDSCVLHAKSGAASGGPSTQTYDAKLQESSDDGASDPYADITGAAVTQHTADSTQNKVDVNLRC